MAKGIGYGYINPLVRCKEFPFLTVKKEIYLDQYADIFDVASLIPGAGTIIAAIRKTLAKEANERVEQRTKDLQESKNQIINKMKLLISNVRCTYGWCKEALQFNRQCLLNCSKKMLITYSLIRQTMAGIFPSEINQIDTIQKTETPGYQIYW